MIEFPKTSLDEVLNSCALTSLYFRNTDEPILSRYVYRAIKLGISPIHQILPAGRYCIAGGVFRSLFFNEVPCDVDIYPLDSETAIIEIWQNSAFHNYHTKRVSIDIDEIQAHIEVITFDELKNIPYKIQLISKNISINNTCIIPKTVNDIVSSFDIIPACFGVDITVDGHAGFTINEIVIHPDYFYSVSNKLLLLNTESSPFYEKRMTAERFYKYIVNYGFRIPDNEVMSQFNKLINKTPYKLSGECDYA